MCTGDAVAHIIFRSKALNGWRIDLADADIVEPAGVLDKAEIHRNTGFLRQLRCLVADTAGMRVQNVIARELSGYFKQ